MRNIAVNDVDDLPRRVLALGSDYPANTQLERCQPSPGAVSLCHERTDEGGDG